MKTIATRCKRKKKQKTINRKTCLSLYGSNYYGCCNWNWNQDKKKFQLFFSATLEKYPKKWFILLVKFWSELTTTKKKKLAKQTFFFCFIVMLPVHLWAVGAPVDIFSSASLFVAYFPIVPRIFILSSENLKGICSHQSVM